MVTVQNTAYMHAREHFKISSSFFLVQLEAPFSCSFIRVSWFVLSIIALEIKQISLLHSASQSVAP